ncbi:MAG TPA: hypothetical protein VKE49_08760 [Myxococcaceae bacterium]|nr:hypothetical protein [Myxococcaceae bacterium]
MKRTEVSPTRTLAQSLLEDDAHPPGFDAEELERARRLARSIPSASASDVESLPEPLAQAVLEASVRSRDPRLADQLSSSAHKAIAKAAKKSLYQLRSLGVSPPERAETRAAPAAPVAPAEELPSLLSAVTGEGQQALVIPRVLRGGGLELLQIITSDEKGITGFTADEIGRSAYRKHLRENKAGRVAPAVEIAREEARQILASAAALNVASGTPYPAGADQALRHLGVAAHPGEQAIPPPEPEDERLATQSAQLHSEPEMQPWLPPEPEIRLLAAKMEQVTHSPLELTEAQRSEQTLALFHNAARAFFTPEMRKLYARRLWRMGTFFERSARQKQAEIALAEARRLFHGPVEPFSRFGEFLFEKVLWLSQRARAGEMPEPPVPGKAPAPQQPQAPGERRSPGGLILP